MLRTVGPSHVGLAGRLCAQVRGERLMNWDPWLRRSHGTSGGLRSLQKGLPGQCFLTRDVGWVFGASQAAVGGGGTFYQRGFVGSFRSTAKSEGICIRPEVTSSACDRDQAAPGTSSQGSARATRGRGRGARSPPPPKRGSCHSTRWPLSYVGRRALCDGELKAGTWLLNEISRILKC